MSATATAADATAAAAPRGKKKLILIGAAVLLVLGLGGGGATWYVMKRAAERAAAEAAAEGGDDTAEPAAARKAERKGPPVFVALDTFTVNLADREAERYAQIGITLELDDPKSADQFKLYMPAIRNNILMVLAHKTSAELLEREGKRRLADEVLREAVRPLGIEPGKAPADAADNPVRAVHFSNFIIQ